MISISYKSKQILVQILKILIVTSAFYFVYNELKNNDKLEWEKFWIIFNKNQSILGIFFILMLSFFNRYFEILKWQNLADRKSVV